MPPSTKSDWTLPPPAACWRLTDPSVSTTLFPRRSRRSKSVMDGSENSYEEADRGRKSIGVGSEAWLPWKQTTVAPLVSEYTTSEVSVSTRSGGREGRGGAIGLLNATARFKLFPVWRSAGGVQQGVFTERRRKRKDKTKSESKNQNTKRLRRDVVGKKY